MCNSSLWGLLRISEGAATCHDDQGYRYYEKGKFIGISFQIFAKLWIPFEETCRNWVLFWKSRASLSTRAENMQKYFNDFVVC